MSDAVSDKFSYTGETPLDQRLDLTGERQAARRADLMDKSRLLTDPPRMYAETKEGGTAPDKRSADEIAMDNEIARLEEQDRPISSTFSPLDVVGPGMARSAARYAPELMGALARTMRRTPEPQKPQALPPEYGPLRGEYDYQLPPGLRSDIGSARFAPVRMRELNQGRGQWSPELLLQRYGPEGYTMDDIMRALRDGQTASR